MQAPRFQKHSLKTRIIFLNLMLLVGLFLILASHTKGLIREELMHFTGQQQRSALSLLTAQVNHGLQDRLSSLSLVAGAATPGMMISAARLQAYLAEQRGLAVLFNAGLKAWSPNLGWVNQSLAGGKAPPPPGISAQALAGLMQDARVVVGRVELDEQRMGHLSLAVPIRDAAGAVVGALVGVMRLDTGHFLTELTSHPYGKGGHYFLIEPGQRLIFATSDPVRRMEVLPPPGVSEQIDRFMQGFEGTTEAVNPHGLEVLVTVQQIPLAGWYASVILPREEAIGLIQAIAPRTRLFGGTLAVLGLGLVWWILRRQLAPMTTAVKTLDGFVRQNQAPQSLQVVREDEVGHLVGGFNRFLDTLNQQQEQVRALAFYDPLTQLPNRRLVLDRLTQEMVRSRRLKRRLALLFIDLDQFKPVNDELGHAVGDWLLQAVAQRIQGCLRESDTAARLGGDEFVVLLPDLPGEEAALGVAEKIRLEIEREFVTVQGVSVNISSSIGVALYPDHGATEKDLMRLGDEAMYLAKNAGRNAVVLCTSQLT